MHKIVCCFQFKLHVFFTFHTCHVTKDYLKNNSPHKAVCTGGAKSVLP